LGPSLLLRLGYGHCPSLPLGLGWAVRYCPGSDAGIVPRCRSGSDSGTAPRHRSGSDMERDPSLTLGIVYARPAQPGAAPTSR